MSGSLRIGIVGGAGWLGGTIAASVLKAGIVEQSNLSMSYRREPNDAFPDAFWTKDNQALVDQSDVVLLSVRPQDWPALSIDASGKLVISVMAGIRLAALKARHATERVVRALPNAAAEVSCSYTPWIGSDQLPEDDRAIVRRIFASCGSEDEVGSEREIDYLTGLTGSGPAFPALLTAAMMDDAIDHGLDCDVAKRAVSTLLVGAGRLLERRSECPGDIVRTFLSYHGTTAAAIEEMRASGFEVAVRNGLSAAFSKSMSMGETS